MNRRSQRRLDLIPGQRLTDEYGQGRFRQVFERPLGPEVFFRIGACTAKNAVLHGGKVAF